MLLLSVSGLYLTDPIFRARNAHILQAPAQDGRNVEHVNKPFSIFGYCKAQIVSAALLNHPVAFEVLTEVVMNAAVFHDGGLCSQYVNRHFEETSPSKLWSKIRQVRNQCAEGVSQRHKATTSYLT
jgi:hypothetical protein